MSLEGVIPLQLHPGQQVIVQGGRGDHLRVGPCGTSAHGTVKIAGIGLVSMMDCGDMHYHAAKASLVPSGRLLLGLHRATVQWG